MDNLYQRIANLPPEKRALLELRLIKQSGAAAEAETIPRRDTSAPCPLSFAQQRLWFLNQLQPDSPAYNMSSAMRMCGTLNMEALHKTLDAIVARHEVLRTTYAAVDGSPVQVIAESRSLEVPVIDLRKWPDAEREAEVQRLLLASTERPFNLSGDLMLRASVLRLGEQEHVLLLIMHHIASDGWSTGVLIREIARMYEAFAAGKPSSLPELPIQYADYAHWQREWLQGEVLETQLSYWKQCLGGGLPMLELPSDRPRPVVQSDWGARQGLMLPPPLSEALKALSRQEGVTLFMALLAVFQTLLHRYTGQDDILVGSPIAGRTRTQTEGLIGLFVNTLVMRTDLSGNPTFRELLGRVREVALGAYAHQDLPFEKLVGELQPERSLSHSPLFQVMFTLQNAPRQALELPGLTVNWVEVERRTAKFDLILSMIEEPEGLKTSLEYSADLFDAATIVRMLEHFQTLLEGIVANPRQRLADLPLLTEVEQRQLHSAWNATRAEYPSGSCLHELFEAQVKRTPDSTAVVFGDQHLTYRELNHRANQLAHYLRKREVGPDALVGICVERSVEMVVGLLGILKAGGAYVPLDPAHPQGRLAVMVEDSQTPVLLTQKRLLRGLPQHRAAMICLDADWATIAQENQENPRNLAMPENLAYVIYTSGSTGRPKGVAVPHRAVNRLVMHTNYIHLEPADRMAQISNCSFDAATFEIWGALLHGARLVGMPQDVVLSPQAFAAELRAQEISTVFLTTALFDQLAHEAPWALTSVRHVLFGGEAANPRSVKEVLQHGPPMRLLHVYGPTESTTFASWYLVQDVPEGATTIPIGRPIANTQLYVLDQHLHLVPVGVPGELCIGGDGLARGYLNRPDLTAEKFIPHPFSKEPGGRLYKTGDLARYLPDGNVEFLGRLDHQVKIRGFRVELEEIEAALGQHPAVQETVMLVQEHARGDAQLVAYVVPNQQLAPTTSQLHNFLKERLPVYMLPSSFVLLDALPLTPNGKVDRHALPAPEQTRPGLEEAFVTPRDALEVQLTKMWEKILDVQPIGIRDNFFELGGHSLLAVRLWASIEKKFSKDLPLATLFQAPTIEQLATLLRQGGWSDRRTSLGPPPRDGSMVPFFGLSVLARYVGASQPFYELQPYGLDGRRAPSTVEEMAVGHLKEILALQPQGPYCLGGYSFGGLVAFEVAQQLRQQGQEVALLVLLDPTIPGNARATPVATSFRANVARHLGNLQQLELQAKLAYVLGRVWGKLDEKVKNIERRTIRTIKQTACRFWLGLGHRLPSGLCRFYFNEVAHQAAREYVLQVYPGTVALFVAEKRNDDPRSEWARVAAGGLKIHYVPGDHFDMIKEPSLQVIAEQLKAYLPKAWATGSGRRT